MSDLFIANIPMTREWAMPCADTFRCPPIARFVQRYVEQMSDHSIDPFARNSTFATWTNDINPATKAEHHLDARVFLRQCAGMQFDLAFMDPPYSPRQISECYKAAGLTPGMTDTQNAVLYSECRNLLAPLISTDGIVLSFGWNSAGMGKGRGFELIEILLVCHGAAHNDTICIAEKKL